MGTAGTPPPQAGPLDGAMTVNQIVARYPDTVAVFNRFGIDTCCGGGVPPTDAAQRDGVDAAALNAALAAVLEAA